MTKNKKHKYTGLPMSFIEPLVKVMRCVDMQLQTHIHEGDASVRTCSSNKQRVDVALIAFIFLLQSPGAKLDTNTDAKCL